MEYHNLIADFAKRTLVNLDLIQAQANASQRNAYEVTQLWNSLLGLIVAPQQRDLDRIPSRTLEQLRAEGWPLNFNGNLGEPNLKGLMGKLRNAITHFNVEFHASSGGQLTAVSVWTQKSEKGTGMPVSNTRGWQWRLDIDDLERIARGIARMYIESFDTMAA